MDVRRVLDVIQACAADGCDAYGLADRVARTTEADTREEIAALTDALGLSGVGEALRTGEPETVAQAVRAVISGLRERHAQIADAAGAVDVANAIRAGEF